LSFANDNTKANHLIVNIKLVDRLPLNAKNKPYNNYNPASSNITSPFPSLFLPGIFIFADEPLLAFLPCLPGALTKSGSCDIEPLATCEEEPIWVCDEEPLGKYDAEPFGRCCIESLGACGGCCFRMEGK
jgi:hypothetical protein